MKGKDWLTQYQDNVTEWEMGSRCQQPGLLVGQHYKVVIRAYCHNDATPMNTSLCGSARRRWAVSNDGKTHSTLSVCPKVWPTPHQLQSNLAWSPSGFTMTTQLCCSGLFRPVQERKREGGRGVGRPFCLSLYARNLHLDHDISPMSTPCIHTAHMRTCIH